MAIPATDEIEVIVAGPPRDRRSRKRLVTRRNVGITLAVMLGLFLVITLLSERRSTKEGEFGALYQKRTIHTGPIERRKIEVVSEDASIAEQRGVNPLLLDGANREQILGVDYTPAAPPSSLLPPDQLEGSTSFAGPSLARQAKAARAAKAKGDDSRIKIEGGSEGVTMKVE